MPNANFSTPITPEVTIEARIITDQPQNYYTGANASFYAMEFQTLHQVGCTDRGIFDQNLRPCTVELFRATTDRNSALLSELKDMPRIWKEKIFLVRDVCKSERYYDYKYFKWRWRPVFLEVKKLVPLKRDLSSILKKHRRRVSNDLSYESVSYPLLGNVANAIFRRELAGIEFPVPTTYREVTVNGSVHAADPRSFYNGNESNVDIQYYSLIDWGPPLADGSEFGTPVGWPGSYGYIDESFLSSVQSHIDSLDDECLRNLYTKIKNSKLDLATDFAEMTQTVGLISTLAIQIGKAFLALKAGNILGAMKSIIPTNRGEISSAFLAFRYGISPLMSDVEGAAQMLAERVLNILPIGVGSKRKKKFLTTEVYGDITLTFTTVIDVKYKVFYDLNGTESISNLSRLGFTSPTNVTWELLPFSFVIDWFLPIGRFLSSLSALDGYKVREITRTVSVRKTVHCDFHIPPVRHESAYYPIQDVDFRWQVERLKVRRETLSDLPSLPFPIWRNPFTWGRTANSIALLSQFLKGK